MNRIIFFLFLIIFLNFNSFGQNYEFYGVIMLNGKKEDAITYKLNFTESKGKIKGHSITDVSGEHETKNVIEGTYDAKSKILTFSEKDIIYTKSAMSDDLFCFVHYSGKIKLESKKTKITGNFNGLFNNKEKCIDGTLTLIGSNSVMNLLNKVNKRIQKSKELDSLQKAKYNPIVIFDSLQTQQMTKNQNLNIFNASEKITFEIWDKGKEDGDIINLYHNDSLILENFVVTKKIKKLEVKLTPNKNIFKIEAVNEGTDSPNTAMIVIIGDNPTEFQSNLKKGESASVVFVKPR